MSEELKPVTMKEICPACDHQLPSNANAYINELRTQLASTGGEAVAAACECSYGPAPHECFYKIPGAVIGESKLLPKSAWPANFFEDEACPGMGTYRCGRHMQPAPAGVVVDRELLERAERNLCSGEEAYQVQRELRALLNQAGGE